MSANPAARPALAEGFAAEARELTDEILAMKPRLIKRVPLVIRRLAPIVGVCCLAQFPASPLHAADEVPPLGRSGGGGRLLCGAPGLPGTATDREPGLFAIPMSNQSHWEILPANGGG